MAEDLRRSDQLTQAITELKRNPFSPKEYANYWRAKLRTRGLDVVVPDCNWREDKIKENVSLSEKISPVMLYVSKELTGKEGLIRLGQAYPEMQYPFNDKIPTDIHDTTGWIKGYATLHAPQGLDMYQTDFEEYPKQQGYLAGRMCSFILSSQLNKDLTGHYLGDEEPREDTLTLFRLIGSRYSIYRRGAVDATFYRDGSLHVYPEGKKFLHSSEIKWFVERKKV